MSDATVIEAALARASGNSADAIRAFRAEGRADLSGLPSGALAHLLAKAVDDGKGPLMVLTPTLDDARRVATDLAIWCGRREEVLLYPSHETSPFLDVAPDRRASMDRLKSLFHLAQGLPFRFFVAPLDAMVRRVPPRQAIKDRSLVVEAEQELDRDRLIRVLVEGGYLRVPVVEDPGTFAVRGALVDVFPPHANTPARIELDDWLVLSIKTFDPDEQRTTGSLSALRVHPVKDALYGDDEIALARVRIRALCDDVNLPTRAAKQLIEDIESGRLYLGLEGFLPAFYPSLETLFDYLPDDIGIVMADPTAAAAKVREVLLYARRDSEAKERSNQPAFELSLHYLDEAALASALQARRLAAVHRFALAGRPDEDDPLAFLESASPDDVIKLAAEDQQSLVGALRARRQAQGKEDALAPLAERTRHWMDAGLRVLFTARTSTQATRLASILQHYEVEVDGEPEPFDANAVAQQRPGTVRIAVGNLTSGFVLATDALAVVTEEEVFGTRAHRKRSRKRGARRTDTHAMLDDLRQLAPGDYVVHADHGVGKYLGLERKSLGVSRDEIFRGVEESFVEVLVVEYTNGDKLFLPVTRLNQLQKYSGGDGHKPKIDRLGGQTFSKTKTKVQKKVKQMAEDLLRLYAQRLALDREPLAAAGHEYAEFEATFPFEETSDQASAIEDVLSDLEIRRPMDRIVCGDVGFGKTEVAMRAAFRVATAGRQVAILCPTTVLAQQHFNTFSERLSAYPLRVEVISRFVDKARQTEIVTDLKDGKVDVLVGTHRLLSKDVHFRSLGLLVVDEEQRFGVTHKERIKKLKSEVDVLTLTATPIPRTLQLAVGGLRDLSRITTAPVDRRAVRTLVTRWDDHIIKEAVQRELSRGGQTFFVYNRIDGLYERAARLQALVPQARIAVAHGQMPETQLERTMTDFVDGAFDVLCSTAIIESGLDIPRANTMLIDRADMFGLAQLYQLRGRVGRSRERAYCYLITPPPGKLTDEARARIEALERFSQLGAGFSVAALDMELRGAGDVLGSEQSGTLAAVGFDMFLHMLQEAVAELRGEPIVHEVDTELTVDVEHYLPDDYIEDVGLRLAFYKRLAGASDEQEVVDLAAEMEDRFGPAPRPARQLIRAMRLRPALRSLRVLGCEASPHRVALHLRADTPLDPAKVMRAVGQPRSPWKLTPDMRLICRFDPEDRGDALDRIERVLDDANAMRKE